MRRIHAYIVLGFAVTALAGALALLCAGTVEPRWLLLGALLLVIGAGLAVWGGLTLRRLHATDPENLSDRITALAKRFGGEVTLSQAVAELGVPDEAALKAFDLLEGKGQCHRERHDEREFYVFPGLVERKVARRCPYCGREFSVKQAVYTCPHCGGDLRLQKE
jgi:DNA-directed RNA polymerase subunit RPC12/RpoP